MKELINNDHISITEYLLNVFERDKDDLLLKAASDDTQRWSLTFILDYKNLGANNFGGTVNYNKKKRQFTFIEYSDSHRHAVRVSIISKCYWSAWEHRDWLYRNVPQYYCYSEKKLTEYLLTH